jgi:hypothetical protein
VEQLHVHTIHDGVASRIVDEVDVVGDLDIASGCLDIQFILESVNLILVGVG